MNYREWEDAATDFYAMITEIREDESFYCGRYCEGRYDEDDTPFMACALFDNEGEMLASVNYAIKL